mmetsp:Transcript_20913/g.31686  ORF Transcript_20913/g.31686 Transcript_20913/m.31686 type:complete len:811 (-) Transcript_20913:64-2496(-)
MASSKQNAWKPIDASLPGPGSNFNHYDDVKSSRQANKDLEGQPVESVGMFFGLEVLDGSLYEVHSNRLVIKSPETKNKLDENKKRETSSRSEKEASDASSRRKRNSSKISSEKDTLLVNGSGERISKEKSTTAVSKKRKKQSLNAKQSQEATTKSEDTHEILALQASWISSTNGVTIHETLCAGLLQQGFGTPTPIQASTLPATILGRRNIVGAAATGSGKTLAYALPILQYILENKSTAERCPLQALILAPTRELAIQVAHECEKLMPKSTGVIVGGLASQKQVRILEKRKPPIIIGTPGRLWEMMSSREHDHLDNLSELRFLVIDEADRMIQQGSFPQLKRILNAVHIANPLDEEEEEDEEASLASADDPDRMLSLPGLPGEARVQMLSDFIEKSGNGAESGEGESENEDLEGPEEDEETGPLSPRMNRQTFIFSATLTLTPSETYIKKKNKKVNKKVKANTPSGAIGEILEVAHVHGKTKVVDLTSSEKLVSKDNAFSVSKVGDAKATKSRLPPGLKLHVIECTQMHKDSHLYTYITTTMQGASGTCLIFCNSIATVKRLGATLQMLSLPVKTLHANMPQKSRLKALDTLRSGNCRAIVVSTDVAARGLDIPNIATIVHYDVARVVGTFIHRAGRTARGMGESAVGCSLSLVASGEDRQQRAIAEEVGKKLFEPVKLDGRLLNEAQQRVNLASKIVSCEMIETRAKRNNKWFEEAALEAGLEVDDDMLDEGLAGGDNRDQQKLREAKTAQTQLKMLLSCPMVAQRFSKFQAHPNTPVDQQQINPIEVNKAVGKSRRRQRNRGQRKKT